MACDPVNEIARTWGSSANARPVTAPWPGSTVSTPVGSPASAASVATCCTDRGVASAGLRRRQFPAARAGPIFHAAIANG